MSGGLARSGALNEWLPVGSTSDGPIYWNGSLYVQGKLPVDGIDPTGSSAGDVITSTGAGSAPTWQASGSGLPPATNVDAPIVFNGTAYVNEYLPVDGIANSSVPVGRIIRSDGTNWQVHKPEVADLDPQTSTAGQVPRSPGGGGAVSWSSLSYTDLASGSLSGDPLWWSSTSGWLQQAMPVSGVSASGSLGAGSSPIDSGSGTAWGYPSWMADNAAGSGGQIGVGQGGSMITAVGTLPNLTSVNGNLTVTLENGSSASFLIAKVVVGATAPNAFASMFTLSYVHNFLNRPAVLVALSRWGTDTGMGTLAAGGSPVFYGQSITTSAVAITNAVALVASSTFHLSIYVVGS